MSVVRAACVCVVNMESGCWGDRPWNVGLGMIVGIHNRSEIFVREWL